MGVSIPRAKGGAESAEGVAQKIDVDMATAAGCETSETAVA